jgi:hypothetical protein
MNRKVAERSIINALRDPSSLQDTYEKTKLFMTMAENAHPDTKLMSAFATCCWSRSVPNNNIS